MECDRKDSRSTEDDFQSPKDKLGFLMEFLSPIYKLKWDNELLKDLKSRFSVCIIWNR